MSEPSTIPADAGYWVDVLCPSCGQREIVPLDLDAKVEKTKHETKLGVKASSKKIDHRCGQTAIQVVADTGEIVGQIGLDGVRA